MKAARRKGSFGRLVERSEPRAYLLSLEVAGRSYNSKGSWGGFTPEKRDRLAQKLKIIDQCLYIEMTEGVGYARFMLMVPLGPSGLPLLA